MSTSPEHLQEIKIELLQKRGENSDQRLCGGLQAPLQNADRIHPKQAQRRRRGLVINFKVISNVQEAPFMVKLKEIAQFSVHSLKQQIRSVTGRGDSTLEIYMDGGLLEDSFDLLEGPFLQKCPKPSKISSSEIWPPRPPKSSFRTVHAFFPAVKTSTNLEEEFMASLSEKVEFKCPLRIDGCSEFGFKVTSRTRTSYIQELVGEPIQLWIDNREVPMEGDFLSMTLLELGASRYSFVDARTLGGASGHGEEDEDILLGCGELSVSRKTSDSSSE